MEIKIIRSHRRRRTVSARLINNILEIKAPAALPQFRLEKIVNDFRIKFERRMKKEEMERKEGLPKIAARINQKFFDNKIKFNSIEYVTTQNRRYGCCNFNTGNIRISDRVGFMPAWVRDYVVLHEMAHLMEPNHGRAFWQIVSRYRLSERARGFLLGAGLFGDERNERSL